MELVLYYVIDENLQDISLYWCKTHKVTNIADFLSVVKNIPHDYEKITFPCLVCNNSALYCGTDIVKYLDELPIDVKTKILQKQRTG